MYKIIFLLFAGWLLACNNDKNTGRAADEPAKTTGLPKDSVAREATFSFIDGCMENAKLTLGDQKAFAFCKCIYEQFKAQNPGADSVQIEALAMDTARVAKMAAACR
jgi:hypothetical protein